MQLQKFILSILIVPALFFIALLVVLPFQAWKESGGIDRLIGLGFSTFFLLLGCFLLYILFRSRTPELHQGSFNPFSASTIEISAVVVWLVVLMVVMWKSASIGSDGKVSFDSGPQNVIAVGASLLLSIWIMRILIKGRSNN